jgi:uncharacterized caspase-like protein
MDYSFSINSNLESAEEDEMGKIDFRRWLAAGSLVILFFAASEAQERGLQKSDWEGHLADSYDKMWAVVIGIDKYPRLAEDQQLSYAVSDAQAVEEMLRSHFRFEEIISLYDKEATRDGIMDVLRGRLGKSGKNDGAFVFFAGHGVTNPTETFGDLGYLVPYDGSDDPTDGKNIPMELIKFDISRAISAKHVFFVMDACYGGLLLQTRSLQKKEIEDDLAYLQEVAREPVRQVLTAGGAGQVVLDGGRNGHSVFTGRLLQKLEETEGFLAATDLGEWLPRMVFQDASGRGQDPPQRPQFGRLFGEGDFFFLRKATSPALVLSAGKDSEVAKSERELAVLEIELRRQLKPGKGESSRTRAGEQLSFQALTEMRSGVRSFVTVGVEQLTADQLEKISQLFKIAPEKIERFRWGVSMSPSDHPLNDSTWDTIWYAKENSVTMTTIRIAPDGKIIDQVLR